MSLSDSDQLDRFQALQAGPPTSIHLQVFGSGATRIGGGWHLRVVALRWKVDTVHEGRLALYAGPMPLDEARARASQLQYESLIEVRANALDGDDSVDGWLLDVIGPSTNEALATYVRRMSESVQHEDEELGAVFEFRRDLGFWSAEGVPWCGRAIEVHLHGDDTGPGDALVIARTVMKAQKTWKKRVKDFAAAHLVDLKNTAWRNDGQRPITARGFKTKMKLDSFEAKPNGDITFWWNDGGLFWGHSIVVRGHIEDGLREARI